MPDGATVTYRYDGTFDGFLSAVFAAYAGRAPVAAITAQTEVQACFGMADEYVATDLERARRVEAGITAKIGTAALRSLEYGFWSGEADKDTVLYRYIRAGFRLGRGVYNALGDRDVLAMEYLCRNISREEQRVKGFARFSQMENGVFYGPIAPKNSLVPLMMPHFADRFNIQPFLLHDTRHQLAGVYDGTGWYLVEAKEVNLPPLAPEEHRFRVTWRGFYDAITIQERINPRLRRGMMPKWYWRNMPEFDPRYDPEQIALRKQREEEDGNDALPLGQKPPGNRLPRSGVGETQPRRGPPV